MGVIFGLDRGYIGIKGFILGIYWDHGKDNGSSRIGFWVSGMFTPSV